MRTGKSCALLDTFLPAVGPAVRTAVRTAVGPTVRTAVGAAVRMTVGPAVRSAVRIAVGPAVAVGPTMRPAMGATVRAMAASDRVQLVVGQLDGACRVFGQGRLLFLAQAEPEFGIFPRTDNLIKQHLISS